MTKSWVKPFYRKQFELLNNDIESEMEENLRLQVKEVKEQVGYKFYTVLDLGAGTGVLARALAKQGIQMTTVELVPELVEFAKARSTDLITSHCGDFYTINLPLQYDVVSYFDGFGVGTDEEQLRLLTRISKWMKDEGCAVIDIYQPVYWQKVSGREMRVDQAFRIYDYEVETKRMLDSWWHPDYPDDVVTQSLRCYTVQEITDLCEQADLQIVGIFPGGAMDFEEWIYSEKVSLQKCLSYRIKVVKRK